MAATEARTDLTPRQKKLQLEADKLNLEAKEQQKEALTRTDFALDQQQAINQKENQAQRVNLGRKFTVDEIGAKEQLAIAISSANFQDFSDFLHYLLNFLSPEVSRFLDNNTNINCKQVAWSNYARIYR